MIFIRKHNNTTFSVQFKPIKENLNRIKQLPSATFDGDKYWLINNAFLEEFENLFEGEFIYITPRHQITGDPPPPPPGMYKKIPKHEVTRINPPYQLRDYQKFGANFLACIAGGAGHAFLVDDVGTGKTLQSISGAHIMQDQGLVDDVLVFCKASLKHQWLREGVQQFTQDGGIVIDGTKAQRQKQYQEARSPLYRYVIVNYELLLHDFDELQELVKAKGIKLCINDEAHKILNPKGKTNNAMAKLIQPNKKKKYPGIEYVFFLTATPVSSRIEQLYGLFHIRRPDMFGKFSEFTKRHLKYMYNGTSSQLVGYKDVPLVRQKTWKFLLRRTENEIDMELPETIEIHRDIPLTALQKKLDEIAKKELDKLTAQVMNIDYTKTDPDRIKALKGAAQSMFYVRKAIADDPILLTRSKSENIRDKFGSIVKSHKEANKSPKWDETKDIIEEVVFENELKLIIFTELETMVQILKEKIDNMGLNCEIYTGKMNAKEKDEAVQRFKNHPDCNIFIATDAGAEGLNLQCASYIINYDLPWNPDVYTQRNGRIRRAGSVFKNVKIINLMANQGIDSKVWEAIENKQNLIDFLVENTEEQSEALRDAMYGE